MQRVCPVAGGIKAYLEDPQCVATAENRRCPFCPRSHRLRHHGRYHRHALLPGRTDSERIAVLRFLCPFVGRTVSLLPDFCLPRRQHGPEILGLFLAAYLKGQGLFRALQSARPDAPGHAVAQSLRDGFSQRRPKFHAYLGPCSTAPPPGVPRDRIPMALVFFRLVDGFASAARAFVRHGVGFHRRFGDGLA
jgi:hypothetical protein